VKLTAATDKGSTVQVL